MVVDVANARVVDEYRVVIDKKFVFVQRGVKARLVISYKKVFDRHVWERPEDAPFHGVRGVIAKNVACVVVVFVVKHFVDELVVGDEEVLQTRELVLQSRHPRVGEVVQFACDVERLQVFVPHERAQEKIVYEVEAVQKAQGF